MKNYFIILSIICSCYSVYSQQTTVRLIDSASYFILDQKVIEENINRLKFELPPYNGKSIFEYRPAPENEILSLDTLIKNEFKKYSEYFMYNFDEFIIQIIPINMDNHFYTLGFFSLKSFWESENYDPSKSIRIPLGGGSSFIKFLFDWTDLNFVYFKKNNER